MSTLRNRLRGGEDQTEIALVSDSVVVTGQLTDKEEKQLFRIGLG